MEKEEEKEVEKKEEKGLRGESGGKEASTTGTEWITRKEKWEEVGESGKVADCTMQIWILFPLQPVAIKMFSQGSDMIWFKCLRFSFGFCIRTEFKKQWKWEDEIAEAWDNVDLVWQSRWEADIWTNKSYKNWQNNIQKQKHTY